jgi:hypothetical protein
LRRVGRPLGFLCALRVLCGEKCSSPSALRTEISLRSPSFGVQSPPSCPNEKRRDPLAVANLTAQNPKNFPRAPLRSSFLCVHAKAKTCSSKPSSALSSIPRARRKAAFSTISTAAPINPARICCTKSGKPANSTPPTPRHRTSFAGTPAKTPYSLSATPPAGTKSPNHYYLSSTTRAISSIPCRGAAPPRHMSASSMGLASAWFCSGRLPRRAHFLRPEFPQC